MVLLNTKVGADSYVRLLEKWMKHAKEYLYVIPERPDLACYGTGETGWGVQTHQKAVAAFGALATSPHFDENYAGMTRQEMLEIALSTLRFSLESHIEGSYHCTNGPSWGNTWISVLGMERMMHAVEELEPFFTADDKALLRKVMISESDWLLDRPVAAGLYALEKNNKPEANLWNGAFLHRTAVMFPDAPNAEKYKEKGNVYLINGISIPSDAHSEEIIDGQMVKDRFIGANFFESYALNHHNYLNVGYMIICLSNIAMLHFMYRKRGMTAPESLYRHVKELWQYVKTCTFSDGRLLRNGGDTRVRYGYCQDYAVQVWLLVEDLYGDEDCYALEEGWLKIVQMEMDVNRDGSFMSDRCDAFVKASPNYFTRLESDRASSLSSAVVWKELIERGKKDVPESTPILHDWHDAYHGAYLNRSDQRVVSWTWDAAEKPQGLCLPPNMSDMAEWRENMSGKINGLGRMTIKRLESHAGHSFPGGFVTWGNMTVHTQGLRAEQQMDEDIVQLQLVSAALPDDCHMLVMQYAQTLGRRVYLTAVKGLYLHIPNDLFNGNHRNYYCQDGILQLHGQGSAEKVHPLGSNWLNVDDQIGIISAYGPHNLSIYQPKQRQIGLKGFRQEDVGMLYCDEICDGVSLELKSYDPNEMVLDAGYVIQSGVNRERTRTCAEGQESELQMHFEQNHIRGIRVIGADSATYMLLSNFGATEETVIVHADKATELASGELVTGNGKGEIAVQLQPGCAKLFRC